MELLSGESLADRVHRQGLLAAEVDFWSGNKREGIAAAKAVEAEAAKLGYKLLADRAGKLR